MFTTMLEGTKDDWMHIVSEHMKHQQSAAADQIIDSLKRLEAHHGPRVAAGRGLAGGRGAAWALAGLQGKQRVSGRLPTR